MNVLEQLRAIEERASEVGPDALYLHNRTYHLCMGERFLSLFTSMWMDAGKPCPFSIRDAAKNVERCIVVSIQDRDGYYIDFIKSVAAACQPRIVVR